MASDQNVLEQLLRLKLDKAAAEAAKQDLRELKAGFVDLAATAEKGSGAATTLTKKISELNRAAQIDKLGKDFGTMATKINDADKAAQLLAGRLADIGASSAEIEKAGAAFASAQDAAAGGGLAGGLSISGIGGRLRQLPSTMIPGTSIGTDSIANILRMAGALEDVAKTIPGVTAAATALTPALGATAAGLVAFLLPIAAIGVALAPLIITFKVLSDEAEQAQKNFQAEIDAQVEAERLKEANIEKARTQTAEANRQEAQDNEQRFHDKQAFLAKLRQEQAEIDAQYAASSNPFERHELARKGEKKKKEIEDAQADLITLGNNITNTVTALGPEINAREADEAAIKKETDAIKARQQASADAAKVEVEARTLAKTATEEQVKALLDSIAIQREVLQKQANDSKKLFDETAEKAKNGDKAAQEALGGIGATTKSYTDQIVILDARTKALTEVTLKAAQANDKAKDAAKSAEEAGKAAKKYQDDVASINEKYYQDQIDTAQKLVDKQTDIQNQAVLAAEQLLQNLQQKQSDLNRDLGRAFADQDTKRQQDNVQRQIDFQRKDVAAEKKFQDDIIRIKKQAKDNEFELALDRDFAGLARSRRQTASQISDVGQQAQKDRQDRLQAFRDQSEDQQRAFINERQQKITQYQRSLADAQDAYKRDQTQLAVNRNRALAAAQLANQKELQVLQDKHTKELNAKYAAAKKEIELAQQSSAVRVQIMNAEYQKALALFQGISKLGSSGNRYTPTAFADGGFLGAGIPGLVNEPGSSGAESFTSGGTTAKFPGMGVFIPSKGGTVNANSGSNITVSNTFNITGSNPEAIGKVIDAKMDQTIRRIFKVKA